MFKRNITNLNTKNNNNDTMDELSTPNTVNHTVNKKISMITKKFKKN